MDDQQNTPVNEAGKMPDLAGQIKEGGQPPVSFQPEESQSVMPGQLQERTSITPEPLPAPFLSETALPTQPDSPPAMPVQPVQPVPVISVPQSQAVIQGPGETASQVQQRITQSEQVKEVKRVRRTYKLESMVGVLFGMIEGSLAIRLAFKLLGAKATNAFVNLLYQFTGIFASPFDGIFGKNPMFGNFELDLASIIAMIIYALVGFGAIQLAKLF